LKNKIQRLSSGIVRPSNKMFKIWINFFNFLNFFIFIKFKYIKFLIILNK
jgi:hypothetical protein